MVLVFSITKEYFTIYYRGKVDPMDKSNNYADCMEEE